MKKEAPREDAAIFLLILVMAAAALAFLPSLSLTKWFIDDKDPSSFAGMVLLMILPQLIFFFTKEAKPSPGWRGWAAALAFFALAASILLFLPFELSIGFWYFRMDMLALSFFLAGSLALLFGAEALWKMRFLIIYSLLAWPLLTLPITRLEPQLTNFTADFLQLFASTLGLDIIRSPGNVFTTPASEIPIIIAPACAALAAILGFFAFILPFACHLRGSINKRLTWLALGVFLVWLLNLARIAIVALLWSYSGISNAVSFFYAFSGTMLFNIAVLAMLLLISAFRLPFPPLRGASIFREGLAAPFSRSVRSLRSSAPMLAPPLLALIAITAAFYLIGSGVMANYLWLANFSGQAFTTAQANPGELPYPEDWNFLASDTGFSENYTVSRFIFERPDGSQVQALVFSSSDSSALSFSAEEKLLSEGFAIQRETRAPIGYGITGRGVSYYKGGSYYSTFYWAQPAAFGGSPTYAAFLFTIEDDANYSNASTLPPIARGFRRQLNTMPGPIG